MGQEEPRGDDDHPTPEPSPPGKEPSRDADAAAENAAAQAQAEAPPEASTTAVEPKPGQPARRPLRVYAFDPQLANTLDRIGPGQVTLEIPWEPLQPGPSGARVQVVDFDGGRLDGNKPAAAYYEPVDLDDPLIAVQAGLPPNEADPRFHQQMVYAVAMHAITAFDHALGRRIRPYGGVLQLLPHAFRGENAFYHPDLRAVLFGYFQADENDPGRNLPGQFVYTCLSHDIIAHEVTHAVLHRIRPWLLQATNPDVPALHEALADLVAIFLHFELPGVVADTVASTRTDLTDPTPLVQLAQQFGYATGRRASLRTALDRPDPMRYATTHEPHARGAILVAAVFEAFLTIYRRRISDLVRLATGGTGTLPAGALPPDLVRRVSQEASRTAQQVLTMVVRALEYLPPVDATFSDFLRAVVTSDRELFPTDAAGLRTAFVDAFRRRGIYPGKDEVPSLADISLVWPKGDWADDVVIPGRDVLLTREVLGLDPHVTLDTATMGTSVEERGTAKRPGIRRRLEAFAGKHFASLGLADPSEEGNRISVDDHVTTFRYDEDGSAKVAFIIQFTQDVHPKNLPSVPKEVTQMAVRRGSTLIADGSGRPRFVVAKPLPGPGLQSKTAEAAEKRLAGWIGDIEWQDPLRPFGVQARGSSPLRLNLARLHGEPL